MGTLGKMSFPQETEWKTQHHSGKTISGQSDLRGALVSTGLHSERDRANWAMTSIQRAVAAIAAILVRAGVDYSQSKAVFKAARARAGLRAPPERRGGVYRLNGLKSANAGNGRSVNFLHSERRSSLQTIFLQML